MTTRDALRSLTLGAPQRELRRVKVPLRDTTKPKVWELDFDVDGEPVMRQAKDGDEPRFDASGAPVMEQSRSRRHPRRLNNDGTEAFVEVREPNLRTRNAILKAATDIDSKSGKVNIDSARLQVETIIALTYEPGSNEVRVFDEKDRQALLNQPAGGFVDDLYEVAHELMNLAGLDEKEIEKNSKGTASA